MLQIFKSEFLRYRTLTLIATLAILAAYAFMAKLTPFLGAPPELTAVSYLVMIGGSLVFGLVQMLLHRRPNHWTFLIQRPLPTYKIFYGLALAGSLCIAVVVIVPWLVMVAGIDAFTVTVVDMRHYTNPIFVLFCALTAYLVGTLAALNASKGAILLAIILLLLMNPRPPNDFLQYAPMLVAVAVLFTLNALSFKPDLSTHLRRPWAIILMALPMSYALTYGLAMSTTVYYHLPKFIMGIHPDNNPVEGTVKYLWWLEGAERVAYSLEGSDDPRKDYYIQQTELAEEDWISTSASTYPRRGQLHIHDLQYSLTPKGTSEVWQFSHDEMLLIGHSGTDQKALGAFGIRGFINSTADAAVDDRFIDVPMMVGEKFLATPSTIYQIDFTERRLDIKHQAPAGEHYIDHPQMGENYVALVTNKHLMLFDPRVIDDEYETAEPDHVIAHPVPLENIRLINTYRLVDGYLLLYRGDNFFGFDKPGTMLVHAKHGGETEVIHTRRYTVYRHPAWIRHYMEMISPVLHFADNAYLSTIEPTNAAYTKPRALIVRDYPASVYWIAATLMLLSAATVFALCSKHQLGRAQTITWVSLAAVLSVPALVAFLLMNPWRRETPSS